MPAVALGLRLCCCVRLASAAWGAARQTSLQPGGLREGGWKGSWEGEEKKMHSLASRGGGLYTEEEEEKGRLPRAKLG